jgi:hypothetical protein
MLAAMGLGCALCAQADEGGPLEEHFSLALGTFFLSSDTTVRADAFESGEPGTPIDYEDTFGLEDDSVFRIDGSWRMGKRHLLRIMYFESERSRRRVIDEEIHFGDEVFPVNADVRGDFDFDITELAYEYVFMLRDDYQLGASFGIHNAGFRIRLSADVTTPGGGANVALDETARTNAPLPVLGIRGRWQLAEKLYALAHAQYFQLGFDDYEGDIQDYEAALVWQLTRHVGMGAAYNIFQTRIETDGADHFRGRLRWGYSGAQLFMRMSF